MQINRILLGSCLIVALGLNASPKWKSSIENEINKGNFTHASAMLDSVTNCYPGQYIYSVDSLKAMVSRIRKDFSLTPQEGKAKIASKIPTIDDKTIETWKKQNYIETLIIDGKEMWFRKAVSNLWLLCPELKTKSEDADKAKYMECIHHAKESKIDDSHCSDWQRVTAKFTLTVAPNTVPAGESIKAWLPFPLQTDRQKNCQLISSSGKVTESGNSAHHTVQMVEVAQKDKATKFEITFSYDVAAHFFTKEYILKNFKPYKKNENYKKYTTSDGKHIMLTPKMKKLADSIIGNEKNPVLQAAKIYNWITASYPWAGARDYGTLKNMPSYVIEQGHGDCGQVALLYITLVRSIGIPARWESGWMIHPWEKNYHDWAETYYEGVGWVPTDVSLGRIKDNEANEYYKTGTDKYRMATNSNYGQELVPSKKYIRTEPLDFQAGEVEWNGGNIEIKDFNSSLSIISMTPIKY